MAEDSVDLFFDEVGTGEPVVLIHGFPLDHTIWQPVVERLKDKANFILPDLRGHGQSPMQSAGGAEAGLSMDLMARDIARLLDQDRDERAVIVGHSMGGYVALAFARLFPERVLGLGLVASQAAADTPERAQGRRDSAGKVRAEGTRPVAEDMAGKMTTDLALQARLKQQMMAANPEGMAGALLGMADRPDSTDLLAGFEFPTVVIAGENDTIIPLSKSQSMTNQFNCCARLFVIPGAGHVPMLENPEATAEALDWLLNEVEIRKSSAP